MRGGRKGGREEEARVGSSRPHSRLPGPIRIRRTHQPDLRMGALSRHSGRHCCATRVASARRERGSCGAQSTDVSDTPLLNVGVANNCSIGPVPPQPTVPESSTRPGGGGGGDSSSSGPTVVDAENPLPLATLSYAQLCRRFAGHLDGLVIATTLSGGAALFVPESGFAAFSRYVRRGRPPSLAIARS